MFKTNFILNPKRKEELRGKNKLLFLLKVPFIHFGLWCGFFNVNYSYVHGDKSRLNIGRRCSTMNTIFNVISGSITIGNDTLFTHDCMVLTGTHEFVNGIRAGLHSPPLEETPSEGKDIFIGNGCFIGSGSVILGKVTIGNNVIIGAGSVVTMDIPDDCFAAGIPAKVIKYHSKSKPSEPWR
jgi:acetyltransferase-like isoleucine patch superfamily enzyme